MRIYLVMATLAWMLGIVHAQQPAPDNSALMQKAITALINQRNNALNAQADAEARLAQEVEENTKLKSELEECKKPK